MAGLREDEPSPLPVPEHVCILPEGWRKYFNEMVMLGNDPRWTRMYAECCVVALLGEAGRR